MGSASSHESDKVDIMHHLIDAPTYWWGLDLSQYHITKHVWMMWIASALLLLLIQVALRQRGGKGDAPGGLRNMFEAMILFIRDEAVMPNMGKAGLPYLPFILTIFFFVLFCNLLGLIPGQATATGNIAVTAALALFSFIMVHVSGIRENGVVGHIKGIVPPVPIFLFPLMLVVEVIGVFTKPFALAIRLWANMTAGHILIFVLLGMIFMFKNAVYFVAPISVLSAVAIYCLEIFVSFLQAYVFAFLTSVFMGLALHPEH